MSDEVEKKVEFGHARPKAADVHAFVERVCPLYGVSIGRWEDRATWRIHFKEEATPEQRQAAKEAVLGFSWEEAHPEYVGAPRVVR